jgi:hypothetical protein
VKQVKKTAKKTSKVRRSKAVSSAPQFDVMKVGTICLIAGVLSLAIIFMAQATQTDASQTPPPTIIRANHTVVPTPTSHTKTKVPVK